MKIVNLIALCIAVVCTISLNTTAQYFGGFAMDRETSDALLKQLNTPEFQEKLRERAETRKAEQEQQAQEAKDIAEKTHELQKRARKAVKSTVKDAAAIALSKAVEKAKRFKERGLGIAPTEKKSHKGSNIVGSIFSF